MKHIVRKVVSAEGRNILGYGVFRNFAVGHIPPSSSINIRDCSDLKDSRPLHIQGKTYRLLGLHEDPYAAQSEAIRLSAKKFVP